MQVSIGNTRFQLVEGDITEQDTDAIVNAAHWNLRGGQGVDGAIHWKAGPQLLEECSHIGGCPIGGAVITGGGQLKARYVIHTVGPFYDEGDEPPNSCSRHSSMPRAYHPLQSASII